MHIGNFSHKHMDNIPPVRGHRLPDDDEREPASPARQLELLKQALETLAELSDSDERKAKGIANTIARIAELEKNHPEVRPN